MSEQTVERTGTLRWEFGAGLLAWSVIQDAANYGRAQGLRVDLHYSGRLFRHGWLVAEGGETPVRRLGRYLEAVERQFCT